MNTPIVDAAPGCNSRQRWLASTVITLTLASLFTASNLAAPTGASADTVTTTYEENDPDIVYTGNWRQMAADSDSGEEAIYLNSPGTASLTFTGTEVSWISRTSPTSGKNNVYIDGVVLPRDPVNGWTFGIDDVVTLHGVSCAQLEQGGIANIQVVVGCPTVAPP